MGELLGTATRGKNGLMPKDGFMNLIRGQENGNGDGTDIKSGYAYIYAGDGSDIAGPVLSIEPLNGYAMQIKVQSNCDSVKIRTQNSGAWGKWREFQLK